MVRLLSMRGLSNSLSPAYAAALALVVIQIGIGLMYKAAQTGGKYAFSPTSSVTISESLKCLLSSFLFYRELKQRRGHRRLPSSSSSTTTLTSLEEGKEQDVMDDQHSVLSEDPLSNSSNDFTTSRSFLRAAKDEIQTETKFGFMHLALFYTLINNIVFVLFRLADPGTIQLIKSGTTLITAIVMILFLGTNIAVGQWVAIGFQVCGIVVTQYKPGGGAAYPVSTYLILLFQTTLSAVAGVYNQKLCKSSDGSLHVMNMVLYSSGAIINLVLHIMVRFMNPVEPSFFTGYAHAGAVMVVVSNVFIGLAMTAVYKYADALIKCFATAISTAGLLYLSPLLFNVNLSFLVIPGTCVVFLATWLYMDSAPKNSSPMVPAMEPVESGSTKKPSIIARIIKALSPSGSLRRLGLTFTTIIAFLVIYAVTYYRTHMIHTEQEAEPSLPQSASRPADTGVTKLLYTSPLQNTTAFIHMGQKAQDQATSYTEGYRSFFHSIRYSDPDKDNAMSGKKADNNILYPSVVGYLQEISRNSSDNRITGLLFFKHDSWISPLGFEDMSFDKLWVLDNKDAPPFICQKDTKRQKGWRGFRQKWHKKGTEASQEAAKWYSEYKVDPEEFCIGWSDMFYLPQRYFQDFIKLAHIFASHSVHDEVALPTIWHIIDQTYQTHRSQSLVTRWADCWRDAGTAKQEDIMEHRCGSPLDFGKGGIASTHFERVRADARLLGTSVRRPQGGQKRDGLKLLGKRESLAKDMALYGFYVDL